MRADVARAASTALVERWRAEATEREARAQNPDVVGWRERDEELVAVRQLRGCAVELEEVLASCAAPVRR